MDEKIDIENKPNNSLPVVADSGIFLYPFMIIPIFIYDDRNIKAVNYAIDNNTNLVVSPTKSTSEKGVTEIYDIGITGTIMRKISLPDGGIKILFQGIQKVRIESSEIVDEVLIAEVREIKVDNLDPLKVDALLKVIREKVAQLSELNNYFPQDLLKAIESNEDPSRTIDLILSSMKIDKDKAYKMFVYENLEKKFLDLVDILIAEIKTSELQNDIKSKVHTKMEKTNREYFLKEQLKQIQKELGIDNQKVKDIEKYKETLKKKKKYIVEEGVKEITKQIEKLSRSHPDSSESAVIQTYLDSVLDIPFGQYSKSTLNISKLKKQLDIDHYSLEKPKERIIEFFAVKSLLKKRKAKDANGVILCLVGPPGVGKTSLANSISTALKRPLMRVALGGLEDVNELRGHRRTYVGAMPGRIVQGLIEAKKMDAVVVLDEIDKLSHNYRGDPTSVMLEILDPEQNSSFRDYYVNFNIDLSKLIFIATANDLGKIPAPLRDRLEIITINSYTPQEKYQIAKEHLLPQELKKHALEPSEFSLSKNVLETVIEKYTRESGVRNLRRKLSEIMRKVVTKMLLNPDEKIKITEKNLKEYLDKTVFEIEAVSKDDKIGVVNGLAWTAVGGDVLKVEAVKLQKGKGHITITGSLGDVMKESASIAHSIVKNMIENKQIKGVDSESVAKYDIHIHVPDGATPKDGPSAGVTMTTALASMYTQKKVKSSVAMTGEVSLTGEVLPIGGLKEKVIAAYKANVKTVILPQKNYDRDLDDIPKEVKSSIKFIPVKRVEEVLKEAIVWVMTTHTYSIMQLHI